MGPPASQYEEAEEKGGKIRSGRKSRSRRRRREPMRKKERKRDRDRHLALTRRR